MKNMKELIEKSNPKMREKIDLSFLQWIKKKDEISLVTNVWYFDSVGNRACKISNGAFVHKMTKLYKTENHSVKGRNVTASKYW